MAIEIGGGILYGDGVAVPRGEPALRALEKDNGPRSQIDLFAIQILNVEFQVPSLPTRCDRYGR